MPIFFNDVAPFCPISRDQPIGPSTAPHIRTTVPRVHDLPSALAAINIAKSIISQIVRDRVINNIHTPPPPKPRQPPKDKTIDKRRHSRWKQSKPVKRKYKYYGTTESGELDKDTWITTERVERVSWKDSGWKTSMQFVYGFKGEGEPLDGGGAMQAGGDYDMDSDASPPEKDTAPEKPPQTEYPPEATGGDDGPPIDTFAVDPELYDEGDDDDDRSTSLPDQPEPSAVRTSATHSADVVTGYPARDRLAVTNPRSEHLKRSFAQYYNQLNSQQYLAASHTASTANRPP